MSKPIKHGPHDWDSAVLAAGMRILGGLQREAAEAVDVDRSTIQRWEAADWWALAMDETRPGHSGDWVFAFTPEGLERLTTPACTA